MKIQRGFGYVVSLQCDPFEGPVVRPIPVGVFSDFEEANDVGVRWLWSPPLKPPRWPHVVTVAQWRIYGFKGARRVA